MLRCPVRCLGQRAAGQDKKSLYDRLGGYNAVAAVVDDFIGRLVADKRFQQVLCRPQHGFAKEDSPAHRRSVLRRRRRACLYTGRDMKTTHAGLGITEDDWNAAAAHLVESLDKFKVPKAEKDDLLAFVTTLKKDIVEK